MRNSLLNRLAPWPPLIGVGLLGLLVILGWHLQLPTLVQLYPSLVPMQYNTAVGFVLGAGAIACLLRQRERLGMGLAITLILLATITLLQYITDLNLGIDELFMHAYITTKTSHPGRMAPTTAISFILTGSAIVYMIHTRTTAHHYALIGGLLTSVISGIAVASLLSYLPYSTTSYSWGRFTLMALHTAIGFALLSLPLGIIAWRGNAVEANHPRNWQLIPLWFGISGIAFLLWFALDQREHAHLEREIETRTQSFGTLLQTNFRERLRSLQRMAYRWERRQGHISESEWKADAVNYIEDFRNFQAIEWVDASYHVRWVVPLLGNEKIIGFYTAAEPRRAAALREAQRTHQPSISQSINLVQGGKGFLIYLPLYAGERFNGFLVGVYRIDDLISALLPTTLRRDFYLSIGDRSEQIYTNLPPDHPPEVRLSHESLVPLADELNWNVRIYPTLSYLAENSSALPFAIILAGYILSTLSISLIDAQATQKQQAKALQQEIEERKLAEQTKDRFISTISHELRTPLTAIRGSLSLLLGNALGDMSAPVKEMVNIAEKNSLRLLALINDLLDVQRLSSGHMQFELLPRRVQPLLDQAVTNHQALAQQHGLLIILEHCPESLQVRADSLRFQQIMSNLLGNAIKFARSGSEIRVRTEQHNDLVRISVTNKGEPIPVAFRATIFEPFTQADASDTRRASGSGLGLSITKYLVEQHHGHIDYFSTEEATTFYFELPNHVVDNT